MARLIVLCALLAAVVAVGGASPPSAAPASDFYMKIKDLPGESEDGAVRLTGFVWDSRSQFGRFAVEPPPEVVARYGGAQFAGGGMSGMSREAASPRDAGSGMASGRRQHYPISITKEVDKATPKLMEACTNGTHVDVEVWERDESGQETLRYTLKEAIITSFGVSRGDDGTSAPVESISFHYEKIEFPSAEASRTNLNSSRSN